jgi:GT2 family glycosyltransferase
MAVTVVIPVYADWPSLKDCIESAIKNITPQNKVVLINDCGPEADVIDNNIKQAIDGQKNFSYYRNSENLGFVGTCNRAAFELDDTNNDILILTSDTKATAGFLEEMQSVLAGDKKIGAVSPRSNNATLVTIPLWSAHQKGIEPKKSYEIYLKIKDKLPGKYIAPTAHGFCMLIRRSLIKEFGLFDEVFGKGYGEEVDFCQRIRKQGYLCAIANHAYVYHMEARSFTLAKKAKILETSNKIIWQRYPDYRQEVREYMDKTIANEKEIERAAGIKRPKVSRLRKFGRKLKSVGKNT